MDMASLQVLAWSEADPAKDGAYYYAKDDSTLINAVMYAMPYWEIGTQAGHWEPGADLPDELVEWIEAGETVSMPAWLDRMLYEEILIPKHGFPKIRPLKWIVGTKGA